jgi:lipopolysaccharide/colanic/teichoic acid biosynthesis glycosyltransferase
MKKFVSDGISAHIVRPPHVPARQDDNLAWPLALLANTDQPVGDTGIIANAPVVPATQSVAKHTWYRDFGKRALDVLFVIATLPVSVPLIVISAIALWFEGGRPFYRQDRLGKGGEHFSILKLRTMVRDADAQLARYLENDPALRVEWETMQKLKDDPRITRVGGFLRATSLDELPQLWNVLKGEMSLVGPRPMMPEQLAIYGDAAAYFSIPPGITGVWQVSTRNENSFSARAGADTRYYSDISLSGDLGLMAQTVGVVLRRTGY